LCDNELMNPRKLTPIFFLLTAFFLFALWVTITYSQTKKSRIPRGSAHVVELSAGKANPNTLIIKTGELVQFVAKDGQSHKIGQGDPDPALHDEASKAQHDKSLNDIQSEIFNDNFRTEFKKAGTYHFHDHLHPEIVIQVIVFDPE
jgi:plastocyanin